MQQFADHVSDILTLFADIVQPRTLEELEEYGFDDPQGSTAPNSLRLGRD